MKNPSNCLITMSVIEFLMGSQKMPEGAIWMLIIWALFPTVLILAVVVKLREVQRAKAWPSALGKIIVSEVGSRKLRPGEPGYDVSGTGVRNEPNVQYEFMAAGQKQRGNRITIGEKTSVYELEGLLSRYPVGKEVTVYFDPAHPAQAVLERDLPMGKLLAGVGCLLAFFIGGPLLAMFFYFNGLEWLKPYLANPERAPFVTAITGLGLLVLLFGLAMRRMVTLAKRWPITHGTIVRSGVEAFQDWREVSKTYERRRPQYKSTVVYTYSVHGRKFAGDRLTLGVAWAASFPGLAGRFVRHYPVGKEVQVHYNPDDPGESVLQPSSSLHYLVWLIAGAMLALGWAMGTGRVG
jgi:hypothetical protein